MNASIVYKEKQLSYFVIGEGVPIVLLHGYLETNEIWTDFSLKLSKNYKVICPDLPGHGKSDEYESQTVEIMAEAINQLLIHLKIEKTFLVGHSMGGYVTLAFAELFPEKLNGICLFHSHPFADSIEKKNNRLHEIALLNKGKKFLLINFGIPKMFAQQYSEERKNLLTESLQIASQLTESGMKACLYAMSERGDRSVFLMNLNLPVLLILGRYDEYFSCEEISAFSKNIKNIKTVILEKSGHLGMFEEPDISLKYIVNFVKMIK
jgi:pimeloyl-ACP methyl ester carboxylesterase